MTDATELRQLLADAIRNAVCNGSCGESEEDCSDKRIQPFVWQHGVLTTVIGSPEMFADIALSVLLREATDAVTRLDRRKLGIDADTIKDAWEEGRDAGAEELRRLAAEAPEPVGEDTHEHVWVTALDGDDQPAKDEAGNTWPHCGVCGVPRGKAQPPIRCNWAQTRRPHIPHTWEPQPGMDPIPCPGYTKE